MSAYLYITELAKELEELEGELSDVLEERRETDEEMADDLVDLDRLKAIRDLKAEMASSWDDILHHGGDGLVPEDEWTDYARQLAEDIGSVSGDEQWPLRHIDWDAAAEELKVDYYSVTFEGTDYYYREP